MMKVWVLIFLTQVNGGTIISVPSQNFASFEDCQKVGAVTLVVPSVSNYAAAFRCVQTNVITR